MSARKLTSSIATVIGAVGCVLSLGFASAPAALGQCPNEALRAEGLSAGLPDCRAYELATPVDKNGGDVLGSYMMNLASNSGNRVMYGSTTGFGDTGGSGVAGLIEYVASRTPDGWSTKAVTPTPATNVGQLFLGSTKIALYSGELDRAAVEGDRLPGAPGAVPNVLSNLYLEEIATRRLETVTRPFGSEEVTNPLALSLIFRGGSADLGVITFETTVNLLEQAIGSNEKLYVYDHGVLGLAGIMPDGSIPEGGSSSPRQPFSETHDTVSTDGSRVLFTSPADGSSAPQLYMRRGGTSTVWVSQSEASAPTPDPQNVRLQAASPDGTKVLFTSTDTLLDNDPGGAGYGLYLYTDSTNPQNESNLTFIARISEAERERFGGKGGPVWGMSDDASRIYFISSAMGPSLPVGGLYLWDKGVMRLVTSNISAFSEEPDVSSDGRFLTFFNESSLTSQSIDGLAMYLYDANDNTMTCVSCMPDGAPSKSPVEASPVATTAGIGFGITYKRRFLSSDGHYVFFSTADALVRQDTNDLPDTYEYDTETGKVAILSSGTGNTGSWFAEASPSGNDVFILTRQALTGWDIDKLVDLYDVRVNGGFPEPPEAQVACDGDACQGTPSAAPSFGSSSEFSGLGNTVVKQQSKPTSRRVSRSSLLARALRACKKKPRVKRSGCEARARKKHAIKNSVKRVSRSTGR